MGCALIERIVASVALAVALSSCSQPPSGHPSERSTHTLSELCEFPREFFQSQFEVAEIAATVVIGKPMEAPINAGNGCLYTAEGASVHGYLGTISISRGHGENSLSTAEGMPSRYIEVDGFSVAMYINPIPEFRDPETAHPSYTLNVEIDNWTGELTFEGGNDAGARAGADMLVRMVQSLKG
ncbi:hypothetical protein ACFC06_20045 [Nocardia sp. NPDC056064]|uniref:hypothetical protein n=1 Tax=Nocardia sp. NPDC056064 TaxID=3345701 RepID=UPI0035DBDF82